MATNYVLDPVLVQEIVDAKNELKEQADKSIPLVNTLETYVNQFSSGVGGVSSFKGRTGAVVPTQDDYSYNQLSNLPTIPQTTNQLSDVTLSNPEDNQALVWSETLQQWVNKAIDYKDLVNKPATGDLLARADCYTILGSDVTFIQGSVDKTVNFGSCAINQKELFNTTTHEFVAKDNGTYKVILSLDSDDTPVSQAGSVVGFTYKLVKFNGTAWLDALDNASQPIKIECIDNVVIGKKFIIGYITVAVGDRYKVIADVNAVGDSIVVKANSGVVMFQPLSPDYKSSWGEAGFYGYFFTTGTASGGSGGGITTGEATVLFENLWDAKTPADLGAQPEDSDLTAIAGLVGNGLLKKGSGGVWSFDTNTYLSSTANADSASKLYTARTLAYTGDVTGTNSFDGTSNISTALTLANSGVTAGTYNNSATTVTPLTVDSKGRIIATGAAVTITPDFSSITSKPTTLSGYGITDAQAKSADLTAIAAVSGTSGFLKKTAANTWSLDTKTYITGNQSIAVSGDASGSGTTSIALTLANSGATAGTYKSVTVDAKGRVTAGTNPTTLSGYGITDAAPSTHVGATGTAHGVATTSVNGFMSAADKIKLDGISGTPLSQTSGTMTPTVSGALTSGTWTPSGANFVEWVKTGKVINFNIVVNGTLTGSDGAISVNLPTPFGALSTWQDQMDIPCNGWTGFTTEVKGLVSAKVWWNGSNNIFWFYTKSNTTPWAKSNLTPPAGVFSLNLTCSVMLA